MIVIIHPIPSECGAVYRSEVAAEVRWQHDVVARLKRGEFLLGRTVLVEDTLRTPALSKRVDDRIHNELVIPRYLLSTNDLAFSCEAARGMPGDTTECCAASSAATAC